MTEIFVTLLNMSLSAGWFVLAVLLLRVLFRKAPKWILCLLWGLVALRLLVPVWPESGLSLIPSAEVIPQDIAVSQTPAIHSGIPVVNNAVNPALSNTSGLSLQKLLLAAAVVWAAGMAAMLMHSIVSYLCLRREVEKSVLVRDNIYCCDYVDTPFILGFLRPRIYVPSGLPEEQLKYVAAHENAHLKRRDHWWKPLGFALLTVHWFNPLMWTAYILLCRDIEQACDEKVVSGMDSKEKKEYAQVLLSCSVYRKMIMACPVAFGEIGVKQRIKAVVKYKKPAVWIVIGSAIACAAAAVCFLTDPKPCLHIYRQQVTVEVSCGREGEKIYTCTLCSESYTQAIPTKEHAYGVAVMEKRPTCTAQGIEVSACEQCGAQKETAVAKLAHTYGEAVLTREPDCLHQGEYTRSCTTCGASEIAETLPPNDRHAFESETVRAATCTEPGERQERCAVCGHEEITQIPVTDHAYGAMETVIQPSCTKEGKSQAVCKKCGYIKTQIIGTTAHKWQKGNCYSSGGCTVCGCENPTGPVHSYVLQSQSEPKLLQAGQREYGCAGCGNSYTEYYGQTGAYDIIKIRNQISAYAAEKGFCVIYSDNQNRKWDYLESHSYLGAEAFGGEAFLIQKGKEKIDAIYREVANRSGGVQKCTLYVVVNYDGIYEGNFDICFYIG